MSAQDAHAAAAEAATFHDAAPAGGEAAEHWTDGYALGYLAGLDAVPADMTVWVTVPLRWWAVKPGDVIAGEDKRRWMVTGAGKDGGRWRLDVARGFITKTYTGDPDRIVDVVVETGMRDALRLCRDGLGAKITRERG